MRIGPNWKHLLKFSHLCLLRKPQQAAQLLATQNPPWKSLFLLKMLQKPQTTKWHVHDKAKTLANSRFSPNSSLFSLFLSRHNMYLGSRYSLSQRGQNHYDVVYSPRVIMGDFNVKKLKVWKILWICKGMIICKRLQKYFESIVPVKQSIFAAVLIYLAQPLPLCHLVCFLNSICLFTIGYICDWWCSLVHKKHLFLLCSILSSKC